MDGIISRFPHLAENIFDNLDNESLLKCKEISRFCYKFLDEEKVVWLRCIKDYVNEHITLYIGFDRFKESWKMAIKKASKLLVREIGISLMKGLTKFKTKSYSYNICSDIFIYRVNRIDNLLYRTEKVILYSPLHFAVENGNATLCELILKRSNHKNPKAFGDWTPLHIVAKSGCFETFTAIITQTKDDKNPRDANGITPLHLAANAGHLEICQEILKNIDEENQGHDKYYDITPFHLAAKMGHLRICEEIINNAKQYKMKQPQDHSGLTPLHFAAFEGHLEICKTIMDNVEVKNPQNDFGTTPFQYAYQNQHYEICEIIMDSLKNDFGKKLWREVDIAHVTYKFWKANSF